MWIIIICIKNIWLEVAESAAGRMVLLQLHDGAVAMRDLDVMLQCPIHYEKDDRISIAHTHDRIDTKAFGDSVRYFTSRN